MANELSNIDILEIVEIAQKEERNLTHLTGKENLSIEQRFKISLCRFFVKYLNKNHMKPSAFSKLTGIKTTRLSEILNYKIELFTIDWLLKNIQILAGLDSKVREHLTFLTETLNLPVMKVGETKKLTKGIKKVAEKYEKDGKIKTLQL
jgi:predicted XRE-type DNA-binding protein